MWSIFHFLLFCVLVGCLLLSFFFFFSSRRRHTRCSRDWSSDVCSSDLDVGSWDHDTRAFARSSSFLFWVALIAAQTMLWTLALPPLIAALRGHWREREPTSVRREVAPSALVLALLVATLVVVPRLLGHL